MAEHNNTLVCFCGVAAKEFVSWTDEDPGRRCFRCHKYRSQGNEHCTLFMWIDPPMCRQAASVIPGLLRRTREMKNEMKKMHTREASLMVELDVMRGREMILEEVIDEVRGRETKGWVVGIVYWVYLLAAKHALHNIVEENGEVSGDIMVLQQEASMQMCSAPHKKFGRDQVFLANVLHLQHTCVSLYPPQQTFHHGVFLGQNPHLQTIHK